MVDSGHFTEEMVKKGDCMKNRPCGEVYTTAIESTPEGVAVFDAVFLKGTVIENLKCTFKKGKLVESSADKNHEVFLELWNNASGDKDQIAEFAIGTNPEIKKPIGDSLFDEKIYGSVHLAIGENKFFGGSSTSSIHWDFVMQEPTVKIDDTFVLEKGKFLVP
jgi:aminopeptidase